jgi:predicted PurR-regulated permease PerM
MKSKSARPPRTRPRLLGSYLRTACLVVIAVCVLGFTLATLRRLLAPLLVAIFLFYLIKPGIDRFAKTKAPRWAAMIIFLAFASVVIVLFTQLVYSNVRAFEDRIPQYREKAIEHLATFNRLMGEAPPAADPAVPHEEQSLFELLELPWKDMVEFAFGNAVTFLETALMALFYLLFLFIEAQKLPRRIDKAVPRETADRWLSVGGSINQSIERYVALKTYINLGLAVSTGVICLLFGLDFWILWAVLMFLANYITYLGSIAALGPPMVLALLQFSPLVALALAIVLAVNRVLWIDYVEIRFLGAQLNVSPLLLLFAIALFGVIWGMAGMILAVPMVTAIKLVLSHFENTQRYAVLMSEE